jgi:hypothetical protein
LREQLFQEGQFLLGGREGVAAEAGQFVDELMAKA